MPKRIKNALTEKQIERAKKKKKYYYLWCGKTSGFGVRVQPSGRKTYYIRYRPVKGLDKKTFVPIGEFGQIEFEEARKIAMKDLAKACGGQDPAAERKAYNDAITVEELCVKYMKASEQGLILGKRRRPKAKSTVYSDRGRIKQHIIPLLGKKRINEIAKSDIYKFQTDVIAGKTAKVAHSGKKRGKAVVEGGAGTATRTVGLLGGIMSYAIREGYINENPVRGVVRPADNKRDRHLSPGEYRLLGKALEQAAHEGIPKQAIYGIWLLVLTGCRLQEIVKLKWSEVYEDDSCFKLDATKEGASKRPIGRIVFDILYKIERKKNCPFVLSSENGKGHYGGLVGIWNRRFRHKLKGFDAVTAHIFRHSFSSTAASLNYPDSLVNAMLGKQLGSDNQYIHYFFDKLIDAADKTTDTIYTYMTTDQPIRSKTRDRLQTKLKSLAIDWLDGEDVDPEKIRDIEHRLKEEQ